MNGNNLIYKQIFNIWLLLRITYGLFFIIAGLDKFFNLIVNWGQYVNPLILENLHINLFTYLTIVAIVEIILGLLVLTKWTKLGAYGIAIWFLLIIVNLLTMFRYFDIAVRDAVLAIGAIVLAKLTEIKDEIKQ